MALKEFCLYLLQKGKITVTVLLLQDRVVFFLFIKMYFVFILSNLLNWKPVIKKIYIFIQCTTHI